MEYPWRTTPLSESERRLQSEMAKAMKIGTRVVRGRDWNWYLYDGGPSSAQGTVVRELREGGLIGVLWDNGYENIYRMGCDGAYDLKLADPLPVQQQESLPDPVEIKAYQKLSDDLADILGRKEYSDVTIKVKDKEFNLHRVILAGRNPYFNSMFNSEMLEKCTGVVSIEDCDPDIFNSFIRFVYTGKIRELSEDNVCALYEIADKYQEDPLKTECLSFMKNKISVDSFSNFIVLALKYDEKELLKVATELFCRKTKEIIKSAKWLTFQVEYPTQASQLYLKSFEFNMRFKY